MTWLPKPGVPSVRVWLAALVLTIVSAIVIVALGAEAAGLVVGLIAIAILIWMAPEARDHLRDLASHGDDRRD